MFTGSNAPESANLTREEAQSFENGRAGVAMLAKTFEAWIMIARAVETARLRADRIGRRQAFQLILDQQGIAPALGREWNSQKVIASTLLKILDRLPEVEMWRAGLDASTRIKWAAPTTIMKHCPIFKTAETPKPSPKASPMARAAEENQDLRERLDAAEARVAELEARVEELEQELAAAKAAMNQPKPKPRRLPKWVPTSKEHNRYVAIVRTGDTLYALYCGETLVVADTDFRSAKEFARDHCAGKGPAS
jgi:hypothetical protein